MDALVEYYWEKRGTLAQEKSDQEDVVDLPPNLTIFSTAAAFEDFNNPSEDDLVTSEQRGL
jgi:hypothetical protein